MRLKAALPDETIGLSCAKRRQPPDAFARGTEKIQRNRLHSRKVQDASVTSKCSLVGAGPVGSVDGSTVYIRRE